ncbi:MAG: DUF2975 domain-containing protein [Marinicella sp.]|nr:DUF2975 domain-containing protein [Xanthomonadales bacterium]
MKTQTILNIMFFLAWFVFIALLIKAGTILTTFSISWFNDMAAEKMYFDLDLSMYKSYSPIHYSLIVINKVILITAQAYVALLMTELLKGFNLKNPFNHLTVRLMEKICFSILVIWVMSIIHNAHLKALEKSVGLSAEYLDGSYLLWSALVYVLAQVFKRGVEIQTENQYTI